MKSEKGITMVALVLTIIVMSILAGIVISSGSKQIKKAELQDLITNMLLIQAKAKIGIEEVVFKTANITDEERINEIKRENLLGTCIMDEGPIHIDIGDILPNEKQDDWYYLGNSDLEEIGLYELKNVNDEEVYYMYRFDSNLNDIEVAVTSGYADSEGTMHYKLSELENLNKN